MKGEKDDSLGELSQMKKTNGSDFTGLKAALRANDAGLFLEKAPKPFNKQRISAIVRLIHDTLNAEEVFLFGIQLVHIWTKRSRRIGDVLVLNYWKNHQEAAKKHLMDVADDEYWGTREGAAQLLSVILTRDFENTYTWFMDLIQTGNPNLRRAIVVAVKYSAQERIPGRQDLLLNLIELLLSDRVEYVRKNLGSFAIGDGLLRVYPMETIHRLKQWAATDDAQVRWNVSKAFASSGGNLTWPLGQELLSKLATDERRFVWKAVSSALHYIGRKQPEAIIPLLMEWRKDPQRKKVAEDALSYIYKKIKRD